MIAGVYENNSVILLDKNQLKRFEMDVFKSVMEQMEPYYTSLYSSMIHITRCWFILFYSSGYFVMKCEKLRFFLLRLWPVSPCVAHPGQSTSDQSSSGWILRFQLNTIRISWSRKLRRLPSTFMFYFWLLCKMIHQPILLLFIKRMKLHHWRRRRRVQVVLGLFTHQWVIHGLWCC